MVKKMLAATWLAVFISQPLLAGTDSTQVPEDKRRNDCERLYERLDFYYPSAAMAEPFRISIGLNLEDFSRVDARAFEFDVAFSLYLVWKDERIVKPLKDLGLFDGNNPHWICDWEPAAVWGEKKKLFDPVIEFKNRKTQASYHNSRADWISLHSNGIHLVRLRDNATFRSPFMLRRFPFDTQTLHLSLRSVFDKGTVVLDKDMPDYLLPSVTGRIYGEFNNTLTPEWKISNSRSRIEETNHHGGLAYDEFTLEVQAQRKSGYYVTKMMLPMLLLFLLCCSVFWIHLAKIEAKVNVAVVSFLSLIAYNLSLEHALPRVGYYTFIDAFIFFSYLCTASVTFLCILSHSAYLSGEKQRARKMERCFRYLLPALYVIGVLFMIWYFRIAHDVNMQGHP